MENQNVSTTINSGNVQNLKLSWKKDAKYMVTGAPLVYERKVLAADWAGFVYCLDSQTGVPSWIKRLYSPPDPTTCPSFFMRKVIGACLPYLWQGFAGSGSVKEGILYIASVGGKEGRTLLNGDPGKLYAINVANGEVLWKDTLAAPPFSGSLATPLISEGSVYAGVCSVDEVAEVTSVLVLKRFRPETQGEVIAYDRLNGKRQWSRKTVNLSEGDPSNAKGAAIWGGFSLDKDQNTLFFGTGNNYGKPPSSSSDAMVAMDSTSGKLKWKFQAVKDDLWLPLKPKGRDHDFGSTPLNFNIIDGGKTRKAVGIGNKNGNFYAFDRISGELIWKTDINTSYGSNDGIRSNAQYQNGRIFLWSRNMKPRRSITVACLDAKTGNFVWQKVVPGINATSSGALANDLFLVPNYSGEINAFSVEDGKLVHTLKVPEVSIGSDVVVHDDMLLFGTGVPKFYGGNPRICGIYAFRLT
ncbi:MAG: PQQ-binding-like beta-propeller repeat protein [Clostridia bacterium]|nr:PQQ-binding-like beta-propeller repeat protein [Clostridia bacterium]